MSALSRVVRAVSVLVAVGCATTVESPPSPPPSPPLAPPLAPPLGSAAPALDPEIEAEIAAALREREAELRRQHGRPRPPPAPPPFAPPAAEHEACAARVFVDGARPVVFPDDGALTGYRDLSVRVEGPPGLRVSFDDPGALGGLTDHSRVQLMPLVVLELPPGPALDAPAGSSGNLFELGGLAMVGFLNLVLLPATLPLGILMNRPDALFIPAPTFVDGMFADAVMPQPLWEQEVTRRSAPHRAALEAEAARQQRYVAWRDGQALEAQRRDCVVDAQGSCRLMLRWPSYPMRATFLDHLCAAPPPPAQEPKRGMPQPPEASPSRWVSLPPSAGSVKAPRLLVAPPRPVDDLRGQGAAWTRDAWEIERVTRLQGAEVRQAWASAAGARSIEGVRGGTLLCRVDARGGGFDIDDSPPELRVRVAFGYDEDVVGQTFAFPQGRRADVGFGPVTLVKGEQLKISLVDVDAFVDDWVGMAVVPIEGTTPIRLRHASFSAECRLAPAPRSP